MDCFPPDEYVMDPCLLSFFSSLTTAAASTPFLWMIFFANTPLLLKRRGGGLPLDIGFFRLLRRFKRLTAGMGSAFE